MKQKIKKNATAQTYEPVIGMEIHVELKTKSKMFCGCKNDPFHAKAPNIYTCPVCLGLPGALPVANRQAIKWCIMLGLALHCTINEKSKFDRKHYFYPDLPKGYQISQYDQPLAINGSLTFQVKSEKGKVVEKTVGITRVHMEEDTGKLKHAHVEGKDVTLVDFNRSGVPLVEIVTEPDIRSGKEAKQFLKTLHQIITYLSISESEMSQGSMRLEPNISVRIKGETALPQYKVEVKNINSFKFVEKAIQSEVSRHIELLKKGRIPSQETRGYVEKTGKTVSQRGKEEAHDYRYFPEPDIPPMRWEKESVKKIAQNMPELPQEKLQRFIKKYSLPLKTAEYITRKKYIADYFEKATNKTDIQPKKIADWIINKKVNTTNTKIYELIRAVEEKYKKETLDTKEVQKVIEIVIKKQKKAVLDYKNGKEGTLQFIVGQVMKKTKGQANPKNVVQRLKKILK